MIGFHIIFLLNIYYIFIIQKLKIKTIQYIDVKNV